MYYILDKISGEEYQIHQKEKFDLTSINLIEKYNKQYPGKVRIRFRPGVNIIEFK